MTIQKKVKSFQELLRLTKTLKKEGKKIVQSHGVFDLIHPGIIRHLQSAKSQGDILIATVIKDEYVAKGPGYPIFNEKLRLENISSIIYVDYVALVDDSVPFECIKLLRPDIFARGHDCGEKDLEIIKKLEYEEEAIKIAGCKIHYTQGEVFSSTSIINQFLDVYPEDTKKFLWEFKKKYSSGEIIKSLKSLRDLKVLVLGDTIIDEYFYCESMSKSLKANLVVNRYLYDEIFAGGVLAVANHIAGLCRDVHLVTLLGEKDSKVDFILSKMRSNINYNFFYREDSPTIVKRRFIDNYLKKKLFEICYIDNDKLPVKVEVEIIEYLINLIEGFDLVLVSDFGHGFMTKKIIKLLEERAETLIVNVQTNGANMGYNMITKYNNISFACIDEPEARLATQDRTGNMIDIVKRISKHIKSEYLIVTRGSKGSVGVDCKGNINITPAFASTVVDRLGAGDAFLSFTAPCFAKKLPLELVSFIGNAVGALAVQIVGNRASVEPLKLYEFIYTLLR